VGPLEGTWYVMYATNWTYGTCILVLDVLTRPRGNIPGLGLIDGDVDLLRRVDYDILTQGFNRIDRILISLGYTFFSESPTAKNSRVKRA
jgi:hypothetical protein